jgi:long-chain acyl-CoA synthetase
MTRPLGVASIAGIDPQRLAIVGGSERITYADLDRRIAGWAGALAARGVTAGGTVAIALRNRPAFFTAAIATGRLGAFVVPVPWRAKADEVEYLVEDSAATVLVAEPGGAAAGATIIADDDFAAELERIDGIHSEDGAIQFRFYTSGTTGRPKAVLRPAGDPVTGREFVLWYTGRYGVDGPDHTHLVCGPLYHTAPCAFGSYALLLGHTVVILDHFDPEECLRLIERERVTWSHMVPINFVRILGLPDEVRTEHDLSSVKRILHAAAPCPVDVKRRIMELFPPGVVTEYYGATEGLATIITAEEWLAKPGSVGRAAEGLELSIEDESGNRLPPGEVGVVYVTTIGGARFSYGGAPEKTAAAWRNDRFTVGDMGYLDADGYLFLTDRAADMIISGGANVYPAEVEGVLHAHPAVADVAVIGVPDDEWGERVHAIVQPRRTVEPSELIAFCRERLAHYKCPTSVELVEALARNENGKLRKRELREPYWAGRERRI